MKFSIAAFAFMAVMPLICGCENEKTNNPPMTAAGPTTNPLLHQDVYNAPKLEGFPLQVRAAFEREFPGAGINDTQILRSSTGPLLYKVVYMIGGVPHEVIYDREGMVVASPPQPTNVNANRPGFPTTVPAGANAAP